MRDANSLVLGEERERTIKFGSHWGNVGEQNKKVVGEVLDKILGEKRDGMLFVSEEGDAGGLVGKWMDEDHVDLGDHLELEEELEEEEEREREAGFEEMV